MFNVPSILCDNNLDKANVVLSTKFEEKFESILIDFQSSLSSFWNFWRRYFFVFKKILFSTFYSTKVVDQGQGLEVGLNVLLDIICNLHSALCTYRL